MIKFFRKIRQQMLTENKFSKYMLYAIGEIILVVVGILIALQINKYNEVSKINLLEKDLLSEVKNGLEYDLEELNNAIDFHRSSLNSQDIIIDWVDSKIDYDDSLGNHFLRTAFNYNVQFKEAPYETLKQIGLHIVKNDTLRNQISTLYDLKYKNLDWWQEDYEKIKSRFRNSFADLGFGYKDKENRSDTNIIPIDTLRVRSDKAYNFNLRTIRGHLNIYINYVMIDVQQVIETTIEMIDREIKE
jgi:hypothetical protein